MSTHYETLQVHPKATAEVIKASYIALIKANHPDRAKTLKEGVKATAKCAELNDAYAVLKDAPKRQAYDAQLAIDTKAHVRRRKPRAENGVSREPHPYEQQSYPDPRGILAEEIEDFMRRTSGRFIDELFRGAR